MTSLGSLTVSLGLDAAQFTAGLTKSQYDAKRFAENVGAGFKIASASILSVTTAAGGAVLALKRITDGIEDLKDFGEAFGTTVENASALEDVIRRNGGSVQDLNGIMQRFNATLNEADPSKGAGAVLKALNLDIEQLKRLDPAEALKETAQAFSRVADDGEKARRIQEVFGKNSKEAAGFLRDLAEQGRLVATVTTEQADAAEKFNRQLDALDKSATDAARALAGPMVSAMNELIDRFKEGERRGDSFFVTAWNRYMENVRKFYGMKPPDVEAFLPLSPRDQLRQLEGAFRPSLVVPGRPDRPDKPTRAPRLADPEAEAKRYLETLERQLERTRELTAVEQVLADIEARRIEGINAATAGRAIGIAQEIDAARERARAIEEEKRLQEDLARAAAAVFEATRTPMERHEAELKRLGDLYRANALDVETYLRALHQLDEATRLPKPIDLDFQRQTEAALQFVDVLSGGLEDVILNFNDLDSVLKSVERQLLQMGTKKLITDPFSAWLDGIVKPGGSGGGGLFDFVGGLFGFRAGGGPVMPGGMYEVAENRPEMLDVGGRKFLLMGNQRGNIDPNPRMSGRSNNTNITVNVPQGTSRSDADQLAARIARLVGAANARMN